MRLVYDSPFVRLGVPTDLPGHSLLRDLFTLIVMGRGAGNVSSTVDRQSSATEILGERAQDMCGLGGRCRRGVDWNLRGVVSSA